MCADLKLRRWSDRHRILVGICLVFASLSIQAGWSDPPPEGYHNALSLYIGQTQGGDNLTDGPGGALGAGDGTSLHLGFNRMIPFAGAYLSIQSAVGYRSNSVDIQGGHASMTLYPVDVLFFYSQPWFRVGGGLTYHVLPIFDVDVSRTNEDERFDNALGFVVAAELNYRWLFLGLRYTKIKYEPTDGLFEDSRTNTSTKSIDGSHMGIYIGFHIR